MLTRDVHDQIVAQFYATAMGERDWPTTLGVVADLFGHAAGVLVVFDPAKQQFHAQTHGKDSDFANQFYHSEVFRRDPRAAIHMGIAPGRVYHDRALYDVDAMLRDYHVRETIEMIGVAHQMGCALRLPTGFPAMFTLLSTEREGTPTVEAVAAFTRLVPHIEQACALGILVERAASTQAMLLDALAARADGVILLDGAGRPGFVNDGARGILGAGDGLGWTIDGFTTARGPETRRLRDMVQRALSHRAGADGAMPGGQLLVTRISGRRPYIVRVLPAPAIERMLTRFDFACVIHIHDLGGGCVPHRGLLREAFGLTEREADLAIELVRCHSLAAAAIAVSMAHNTARNHLHAIFAKCGVATQAEAVQLLSRLP